jgi:hypothetical protein
MARCIRSPVILATEPLLVRTFVCRHLSCARRILTERLPDCAALSARNTMRLVNALQAIGIALGGQAGTRLAAPMPHTPALQAVGVDAWAWRRGHRDGTILVHLADHRLVPLSGRCLHSPHQ